MVAQSMVVLKTLTPSNTISPTFLVTLGMFQQNQSNTLSSLPLEVSISHLSHGESKSKRIHTLKMSASTVQVLKLSVSKPLNQHTSLLTVPKLVKVMSQLVSNVPLELLAKPMRTLISISSKMIMILSPLNIFHQNLVSTPFKSYLTINKFPLPQLISPSLQIMMLPKSALTAQVLNPRV